jgi:hypothetical protein
LPVPPLDKDFEEVNMDNNRKRRYGPAPLDPEEKRTHTVSVRLNPAELEQLDKAREPVNLQRGEYLRCAALDQLPPTIPEINRKAWLELSKSAANLNQIAKKLNEGDQVEAEEIAKELKSFRMGLICPRNDEEG